MLIERNEQIEESVEFPLMSFVGNVGVVPKGEQYDRSFLVKDESKKYKKTVLNDFIYSSNNLETGSIGFNKTGNAVISPVYSIFSSNSDSESQFIGLLSSQRAFINKMVHYRQGVMYGQWRIHEKDFLKILVDTPCAAEQNQIIHFFRSLDNAIHSHQQKLNHLRELKKGFLQQMFPQDGESVPRVRFAGFAGNWGTQKLNDVAEFSKGSGYSKGDLAMNGVPIILYGRLYTKYETVIEDVDTFALLKENSVMSQGGEVIVPSSGETADDISRASVVLKSGIILGGDLNIIKTTPEISPVFLAITISNGNQQKELSRRAQGKSVVHINNSDLKDVMLQYPSIDEQTAIGTFFRSLDKQIAAQVQKLEQLKQLKAAYLQKMFV